MAVRELSEIMKMSYMGVKDLCLNLEKTGYLSTWRQPKPRGRPELLYRLTKKAEELFSSPENSVLLSVLEAAGKMYGPMAPGKLLLSYFQEQTRKGKMKVRGDELAERMKWLARWRDGSGYFASVESGSPPILVERNHPLQDVLEQYPEAVRMEEQMLGAILGCPVRLDEKRLDGSSERRFIPLS